LKRGRQTPSLEQALNGRAPPHRHRPWPRLAVSEATWTRLVKQLADGRWTLAGLWGDYGAVHMALLGAGRSGIAIASLGCPSGQFPSVARHHAPAQRLERTIRDLFGYEPVGAPDARPWLDHGRWPFRHPLGAQPEASGGAEPYAFLAAKGEGLHQIPVGPVHAGIIEPGHFRFTANGEAVVRLEERLGYTHKGVEALMAGAPLDRAARLAGRVSGDSSVAYTIAFARAAEAALDVEVPARAHWLRALMAELERIANHLGDIGAVCNDASFAMMHAQCGALRERVLRLSESCFGHRLMMDAVVPGGVARDLDAEGVAAATALLKAIRKIFPRLVALYDDTASLQDRTVGTGRLSPALARQFGCGGFVGRASGRDFDARRDLPYPPYDELPFDVPIFHEGDVNARLWVRIREVEQSMDLIDRLLDRMPAGAIHVEAPGVGQAREGLAMVEGFRGDILCWLRLGAGGSIERCHLRDPSWFQWPLLEAVVEGNIVADFPLCNKSFNCSYSGCDL